MIIFSYPVSKSYGNISLGFRTGDHLKFIIFSFEHSAGILSQQEGHNALGGEKNKHIVSVGSFNLKISLDFIIKNRSIAIRNRSSSPEVKRSYFPDNRFGREIEKEISQSYSLVAHL